MNLARARRRLLALERYDDRNAQLTGEPGVYAPIPPSMYRRRDAVQREQAQRHTRRVIRELDRNWRAAIGLESARPWGWTP